MVESKHDSKTGTRLVDFAVPTPPPRNPRLFRRRAGLPPVHRDFAIDAALEAERLFEADRFAGARVFVAVGVGLSKFHGRFTDSS